MLNIVEDYFKNFMAGYNYNYNRSGNPIKVGILYSTGVDSSVLLHVANMYKETFNLEITILYISFNDFKNSEKADDIAKQMSEIYDNKIKLDVCDLLNKSSGVKIMARDSMKELALSENFDIVLTGHHTDDQIETVLFRLFRGSGVDGLCGMEYISEFVKDGRKVLFGKPFLEISKVDIIEYARLYDVTFIEDETNYNTDNSDRNYIRNEIVPIIKTRFNTHSINTTINNIKQYVKDQDNKNLNIDIYSGTWSVSDFISLSIGNRLFVIREYFRVIHGYNFNQKTLGELRRRLEEDISDLCVHLNNGFMVVKNKEFINCEYSKSD